MRHSRFARLAIAAALQALLIGAACAQVYRCPGHVYQDEPCSGGDAMRLPRELNAMASEDRTWTPETSTILRNAPAAPYVGGTTPDRGQGMVERRPVIEGWAHPGAGHGYRRHRHLPPPWATSAPHGPWHHPYPARPGPSAPPPVAAPTRPRNHGGYFVPR